MTVATGSMLMLSTVRMTVTTVLLTMHVFMNMLLSMIIHVLLHRLPAVHGMAVLMLMTVFPMLLTMHVFMTVLLVFMTMTVATGSMLMLSTVLPGSVHMAVQIFHIVIMVLMLCVQLHVKITHIQPGLFHPTHLYLKPLHREAVQCLLKHLLIRAQVKKRRHRHISADSCITFQIECLSHICCPLSACFPAIRLRCRRIASSPFSAGKTILQNMGRSDKTYFFPSFPQTGIVNRILCICRYFCLQPYFIRRLFYVHADLSPN